MTHRVFSRNASSSRAIPARKIRNTILTDMATPSYWGANRPGMQAEVELAGWRLKLAKAVWTYSAYFMLVANWIFEKIGLHKQIANRVLESWSHIEVVVTATDWDNFYTLRNHPMAQPEIQELATKMLKAHNDSVPTKLEPGQWHLPFIAFTDICDALQHCQGREDEATETLCKMSAARCARVSYLNHEGKRTTIEEDLALFDRLMGGDVKHASPTEHQAKVPEVLSDWLYKPSNLRAWLQFRRTIEGETVYNYLGLHHE
jgi:hypothetical protein